MKDKYLRRLKRLKPREIQSTIMLAFSLISISIMLVVVFVLYIRFFTLARGENIQRTRQLLEQTGENLEDYLIDMRQISDTAYYNVIKERDFSTEQGDIQQGLNLLYEANKSNLRSIAVYNDYGSLLGAEPVMSQKEDPDVTRQDWYLRAMAEMENMHFSVPHIQNLFRDTTFRYYWVITLSRVIEITDHGVSRTGVLLVDMDYSRISRIMKQMNSLNNGQYYYLCDSSGRIIYHPRQIQISEGICSENSVNAAKCKDGVYNEVFEGEHRQFVVNTISYTGWKLVGVVPSSAFTRGMMDIRYFVFMLMLLMVMMLVIINRLVSVRISRPILKLNESVMSYEAGEQPEIYIGGSEEIMHLGYSIQKSYEQIDQLMQEIVMEQTERRKSELEALQSQINPHFLYNALESITWMVEGERNDEAVFMISQLARLFRISLSKGRTIISIRDELVHAQSYMNIQKIRYKNAFAVTFNVDENIQNCCIVKLVIQPILENAINYGLSGMDEDKEIKVEGRRAEGKIIISVSDNGIGMPEETVRLVLTDSQRVHKHGSGVGLVNVHRRIQLLFGREYGLVVESEPDEGTTVSIVLPEIPYTQENCLVLEKGSILGKENESGDLRGKQE